MYFYFYDKGAHDKGHASTVAKIESTLLNLGINGRSDVLSQFKNPRAMIEDGITKGTETVVVVGTDETFLSVMKEAADFDVMLGYIPLEQSPMSEVLGMPVGEKACETISRRLYKTVDLMRVGNEIVLSSINHANATAVSAQVDEGFSVKAINESNELSIVNAAIWGEHAAPANYNDGKIETRIIPVAEKRFQRNLPQESTFFSEEVTVTHTGSEPEICIADGSIQIKTPFTATIEQEALRIIVGKKRIIGAQ